MSQNEDFFTPILGRFVKVPYSMKRLVLCVVMSLVTLMFNQSLAQRNQILSDSTLALIEEFKTNAFFNDSTDFPSALQRIGYKYTKNALKGDVKEIAISLQRKRGNDWNDLTKWLSFEFDKNGSLVKNTAY